MKKNTNQWVEFAKRDLKAADELKDDEYLANISLFHSQQAVEKILKAIIEETGIQIPRIHNVTELYKRIGNLITIEESSLDILDNVYIEARYPADMGLLPSGHPTTDDANEIYTMAEQIFNKCLNYIENKETP